MRHDSSQFPKDIERLGTLTSHHRFVLPSAVISMLSGRTMNQFDDRTRANLDVVLEKVCRFLPHGGDHAFREKIARKLIESARQGTTTLRGLTAIGREAVKEASLRQPAAARRWPVYFNRTPQT